MLSRLRNRADRNCQANTVSEPRVTACTPQRPSIGFPVGGTHTFGTRMAAAGVPMRTIMEWMRHADFKTSLIYADFAPSAREAEMVESAFSGHRRGQLSPTALQLTTAAAARSDVAVVPLIAGRDRRFARRQLRGHRRVDYQRLAGVEQPALNREKQPTALSASTVRGVATGRSAHPSRSRT